MTQSMDSDEPAILPDDAGGGQLAAEHLLLAINGQPTHGVHTVPCRLVARGSTSPGPP